MNRLPISAVIGTIALAAGCTSEKNTIPIPAEPTSMVKPINAEPVIPIKKAEENTKALLTELIPSTDPNRRINQLQQGRSDPFSSLVSEQVDRLPVVSLPHQVAEQVPLPPPPPNEIPPNKVAGADTPQADLARKIAVLGVIQIGERSHAIIKQPQDMTTRYVSEGDRLSNSGILVKKISIGSDFGTQVVFEENGIEVSKVVDGVEVATAGIEPQPVVSRQDVANRLVATNIVSSSSVSSFDSSYVVKSDRSVQKPKKSSVVLRVPSPPPYVASLSAPKTRRNTVRLSLRSALVAANPSPSIPQSNPFPKQSDGDPQPLIIKQQQPTPFLAVRSQAQSNTESKSSLRRQQLLSQLRRAVSSANTANSSLASRSFTTKVQSLKQQQLISQLREDSSADSSSFKPQ